MTNIILSYRKYFKHLIKNDKKCLDTACGKVVICLQVIDIRFCYRARAKILSAKKVFKRFKHFSTEQAVDMRKGSKKCEESRTVLLLLSFRINS
jgi:hypothetical protein